MSEDASAAKEEVSSIVRKFAHVCMLSSFLSRQGKQCAASKLDVSVRELALFKRVLPELIAFQYEETVFDAVFGSEPESVLVFYFVDKFALKRSVLELQNLVKTRVKLFREKIVECIQKSGSLAQLKLESESYVPEKSFLPVNLHTKGNLTIKSEENIEIGKKAKFDEICGLLTEIVEVYSEPARSPRFAPVPPLLKSILNQEIKLYTHQSQALDYLLDSKPNEHLVVSTATSSGKSLIFQTIVKFQLANDPNACAMFVYPTKALAHDQLRSFDFENAYSFDGDVPLTERDAIVDNCRVLFVNPDILHTTILPQWQRWTRFIENLKFVVIDEVHYYTGIFGANVAMVLRRLRRIAFQLGAEPKFIGCSATVNEPDSLLATLIGVNKNCVCVVGPEVDGSPLATKKFVFCTTELMGKGSIVNTGRFHPIKEAAPLLIKMVNMGLKIIAFCRFRRECEILLKTIYELDPTMGPHKDVVGSSTPLQSARIMGYRGGYNAEDRRLIEKRMFEGSLQGIVATSALEVGIDIGSLDAAVIVGFPYSIASFRQQIGRVGRRSNESFVVYIADGSVLDQAHLHSIDNVLHGPLEHAPIAMHESIVRSHIQAAAYEQPLDKFDMQFFPKVPLPKDLVEVATDDEPLLAFPYKPEINIRKNENEEETLVIDEKKRIIERVDRERVGFTLYEGAVFVHQGASYLVTNLEENLLYAQVKRTKVKWTTRQRDYTDIDPINQSHSQYIEMDAKTNKNHTNKNEPVNISAENEVVPMETESPDSDKKQENTEPGPEPLTSTTERVAVNIGKVKVTTVVFGYYKFNRMNQIIDECEVNIPPIIRIRQGLWINISNKVLQLLNQHGYHIAGSIHSAEHLFLSTLPLLVAMSPGDVSTECKAPEKEFSSKQTLRQRPARLVFYENYSDPEGNGILQAAYRQCYPLLMKCSETVESCPCLDGCYSCIAYSRCTEHNTVVSKRGAQLILRYLTNKSLVGLPEGPEPNLAIVGVDATHSQLVNVVSVGTNP